jgi:acyl carrier protein
VADLADRLVRCISSVFPALTDQDIRSATAETLVEADSLAAVTLLALIDEEFGVEIDPEGLLALGSFQGICRYLQQAFSNAALEGQGNR